MTRAARPVRTLLVTHRGVTTTVELRNESVVIGRARECDVFLDDPQVSRRHAIIHVRADRLELEDLGSHNGTRLLATMPETDETQTRRTAEISLAPNAMTALPDDALIQVGGALITVQTRERPRVPPDDSRHPGFIVVDAAMQRLLELAERVAPTNLTVLVLGESGSGKEMLARYVHQQSPRAAHRLISLNCGALPETLLESELFGYEKGAFTGAATAKPGLLEAADRGTLFLDEIGELTPALQVKLLRVLEDRQVLRVGALEHRAVDVRFVAATNRDLEQQVAAGKFREDLYYRIYGVVLSVPALRERRDDIEPLAQRFLTELAESMSRPVPRLSAAARDKLVAYHWPGNVRQLKNVVHRALVMTTGDVIEAADVALPERDSQASVPAPLPEDPKQLHQLAEDAERKRIVDAIEQCAGNQTRAAQLLGITRRALVRRLEKFNLPRPRRAAQDGGNDDD